MSRSASPSNGRHVACRNQRRSVQKDSSRPGPRPKPGSPLAHLSREPLQQLDPRSNRVATNTTAAILRLRPCFCRHFRFRPRIPRPLGDNSTRSGARFRCSERKQRREAGRSGDGQAAGDGGGRHGLRPGRSRGHGAAAAGLGRSCPAWPAAMSGYLRRPGATPLSRVRSLAIPDGERGRGRVQRFRWAAAAPARSKVAVVVASSSSVL